MIGLSPNRIALPVELKTGCSSWLKNNKSGFSVSRRACSTLALSNALLLLIIPIWALAFSFRISFTHAAQLCISEFLLVNSSLVLLSLLLTASLATVSNSSEFCKAAKKF